MLNTAALAPIASARHAIAAIALVGCLSKLLAALRKSRGASTANYALTYTLKLREATLNELTASDDPGGFVRITAFGLASELLC